MFGALIRKCFGTKSDRDIKKMAPLIERINSLEEKYQKLPEEELKGKTEEFKKRLSDGETVDDIMCEAFALVKNTCRRLLGTEINVSDNLIEWDMIPYDVQLIGAIVLHRGNIGEMATGEGKTLVATMPLYLNALTGKNCQLVTVNDYLAERDAQWMGAIYEYLGLTVGCLQNQMPPEERREAYKCDITYGTNSEFGFDYLRDMGMASEKKQLVQRDHFYVILDEVDSILIDEARTPLIISGPVAVSTHQFDKLKAPVARLFRLQNDLCSKLVREARSVLENDRDNADAVLKLVQVKMGMPQHKQLMHILEDGEIMKKVEKMEMNVRSDQNRGMLQEVQSDLYFSIDEKSQDSDLTEKGCRELSPDDPELFVMPDLLNGIHEIDNNNNLSDEEKTEEKQKFQEAFTQKSERLHNLAQLLKAYCLFLKDIHYVVKDNKVMIVDEHTGRLMPGRRFSEGLHQALEAKENVKIERETQTLASITIQNYFRLYGKLAGMTGTAETEASEFHQIYNLDVTVIPTNEPCMRKDINDKIYKTKRAKFNAVADDVAELNKSGRPVLLGTISVEDSEIVSRILKRKKIPHNVLNAKNHAREAEIIARAGQQGAVTVATNMAGRGTDIKLGESVAELGGLHVIGSARHDSRRIDRQLRGRCARQGDPGTTAFYISLEDDLMRLFGSDRIVGIMERFGLDEGEELQHPWLNKSIQTAQKRVEQHHFAIRKRTLEYDDVMNKQREIIYKKRHEALNSDEPRNLIMNTLDEELEIRIQESITVEPGASKPFLQDELLSWLNQTFPLSFSEDDIGNLDAKGLPDEKNLKERIFSKIKDAYQAKEELEDPETKSWMERNIILDAIDRLWQEHLHSMDELRGSIGLRAFAQKDPLVEYKTEAFGMFDELMISINQEILSNMFRNATSLAAFEEIFSSLPQELIHNELNQFEDGKKQEDDEEVNITFVRNTPKVGRNDLCPCGSGKKYKKCCGK